MHCVENARILEAEPEVVDLLAVLVAALRPRYAIETGCYHGTTSAAIGAALVIGHLDTMDVDPSCVEWASAACSGLPVTVHECNSLEFIPRAPIDFCFLDSGTGDVRMREAEHFVPYLADDGLIAMHDSRDLPWPVGWTRVNLGTPRGLLLMQKSS